MSITMKRLGLTGGLVALLCGCFYYPNQETDTVSDLVDAEVLGKNHLILMNYFVSGWDFYRNAGLIKINEKPNISCNNKYRARVEILTERLESDFQKSLAPNKNLHSLKSYPVNWEKIHEVCEVILRNENGEWFGALVLDNSLVYFENRNEPHDPFADFRYVKRVNVRKAQ